VKDNGDTGGKSLRERGKDGASSVIANCTG